MHNLILYIILVGLVGGGGVSSLPLPHILYTHMPAF